MGKRWKDACDGCLSYQYDCHSYNVGGTVKILCPACAEKIGARKTEPKVDKIITKVEEKPSYLCDKDVDKMVASGWKKIDMAEEVEGDVMIKPFYNGKPRKYGLLIKEKENVVS